ncbi:DUF4411 family protein [Luteococcus sp. Sow4_B9]|uniref:DUF4411 family protein n=1 Tax=Luteococcus sp. Sow4_B9 TaxID=3438792 RepID=UPI003F9B5255
MTNLYSFDTSALIDGLERFYPQKNFPALWEKIDDLIAQGRLLISEEAWKEAIRVASATKDWCEDVNAARNQAIRNTDAAVAAIVGAIMRDYPQWAKQGRKNGADPFVIAVAEALDGTVITGEKGGGPAKPKIPYVCDKRQVPHGALVRVITSEGWTF